MNRRNLKTVILSNDELIEILDTVETSIHKDVLPSLESLIKQTKDLNKITDNVLYGRLKLKHDDEFFKRVEKIVVKYNEILPSLKDKIKNELSDNITSTSGNINNNIALSMISAGVFLSTTLVGLIQFIVANNYSEQKVGMDKKLVSFNIKNTLLLVKVLPEFEKADFKKIVETIGEIPILKTLRYEETSDIRVDLTAGFLNDTFKWKSNTLNLIKSFITSTIDNDDQLRFICNPIYHTSWLHVGIDEYI